MPGPPKGMRYGGRQKGTKNKITNEVRTLAQAFGPMALKELGRIATQGDTDAARVSAIREILDRGYGKTTQGVEHSGTIGRYDLTKISDADLAQLDAILGTAAALPDPAGDGEEGEGEAS